MEAIAYYDGTIGSPDELMVPFNDRSHFFGDGVYDASTGANGKVFLLEDHLDRFYSSAAAFDIRIPLSKDELGKLLEELLSQVEGRTQFVVTRNAPLESERYELVDEADGGGFHYYLYERK